MKLSVDRLTELLIANSTAPSTLSHLLINKLNLDNIVVKSLFALSIWPFALGVLVAIWMCWIPYFSVNSPNS